MITKVIFYKSLNFLKTIKVDKQHRDHGMHTERAWVRQNIDITLQHNGLLDLKVQLKILFAAHLKHPSFWPSADLRST